MSSSANKPHGRAKRKDAALSRAAGSSHAKAEKAKKKSQRKKLYELHSWLGFHLALIMGVVLFTGTIATVSNEIDWLLQHDMRVAPGQQQVSWGEMERAIEAHAPDRNFMWIESMGSDYFAYRARMTDAFGNQSFVHVNQWTGEVTGETHPLTVQRFFRDLHRYLFMPGVIALPIICSLAIVLLISLYTGLKTSRNWRTLMTRVRFDKGARIMWGDAHKAAGLWSIWFFIVIALTGIWYLVEWGYGVSDNRLVPDRPRIAAERVLEFGEIIDDRPIDEIVAAAQSAYPELQISQVSYPSGADGPFTIYGFDANPVLRQRANMVFVDPEDASVIEVLTEHDLPLDTYLNEMADPLHFGNFGGLASKLIWFVFGVFLTGLSFTGVWLTWKRLKTSRITRAQLSTTPLLLTAVILGYFYVERYLDVRAPPAGEQMLAKRSWHDGSTAQLAFNAHAAANSQSSFRLQLNSEGRPNLTEIELCVSSQCQTTQPARHAKNVSINLEHDHVIADVPDDLRVALRFADKSETILRW